MTREGLQGKRLAGFFCGLKLALAISATFAQLESSAAVTDISVAYDPLVDSAPVVSWTATDGAVATAVQTSLWADKDFVDVSGEFAGEGSFVFTNVNAAVSSLLYYRLRCTDAVGDSFTTPVAFRRVRQLERDASDETKLAAGVTMLPEGNYTTDDPVAVISGSATRSFDGAANTYCEVRSSDLKAVEAVVGVCLPEAAHVTDVFMYPRDNQKGRLSYAAVLSCTSHAAFEAKETHLLAGKQTISTVDWYRYQPDDSETLYQCIFAYAGPLHNIGGTGNAGFFGNVAEIRFYGWTPSDEAAAGLSVGRPAVYQDLIANTPPVVAWSFTGDIISSAQLQVAEFPEGPWQNLGEVRRSAGNFEFVHEDLLVGLPVYYRVAYVSRLSGDQVSEAVAFRRVRQLERDASDETKFAAGVTKLPEINYTTTNPTAKVPTTGGAEKSFDGDFATSCNVFDGSGAAVETLVGVCLPEAAHVTDVFMHPKDTNMGRLSSAAVLSCTSYAAFEAKETHLLAGKQTVSTFDWYRYQPDDSETLYQCIFAYAGPLHDIGIGQFFGWAAEIRFYGWTPSDEAAAGLRIMPPSVAANLPESSIPTVSWQVRGTRIESSQVEYSYGADGPFVTTGTAQAGAGTFECAVPDVVVGPMGYYRIRYTMTGGDETVVTDTVAFRRVRQLERDASDETKLAAGVTTLPEGNYTTDDPVAVVGGPATRSFDGATNTLCEVRSSSYSAVEAVVGVCLPEAAHVTDVFMFPRSDTYRNRLSYAAVLSCTSYAAFEAKETHLLAGKQAIPSTQWYRYQPDDSETLYQCIFAYAGPLHNIGGTGNAGFFGNVAEIRFYGWTPSDEAATTVMPPTDVVAKPGSLQIRLSWTAGEHADSVRVERRVAGTAEWTIVATVPSAESGYVDAEVQKRVTYEYRLSSIGLGGRIAATADVVTATPEGPGLILFVR